MAAILDIETFFLGNVSLNEKLLTSTSGLGLCLLVFGAEGKEKQERLRKKRLVLDDFKQ